MSAALRLAHRGLSVEVLDMAPGPGGKMRTRASVAGPVDIGPTVMTMRHVFEELFASVGARLEDHVTLEADTILARHFWRDGSALDLHADPEASAAAVRDFAGPKAEREFRAFTDSAQRLYEAFDRPVMREAAPSLAALTAHVLSRPSLIPAMAPGLTLAQGLRLRFREPRLRQLFGRYATYVGGSPHASPAVLGLIWHAEATGVWRVKGGMHRLAHAMAALAERLGAEIAYGTQAARIEVQQGRASAVVTADGTRHAAAHIVFNGDPKALADGHLGPAAARVVPGRAVTPRSLSAFVWGFAAEPRGAELAHHNVFFGDDPRVEFGDIAAGRMPRRPDALRLRAGPGRGGRSAGPRAFRDHHERPARAQGDRRGTTDMPDTHLRDLGGDRA
jgi:1-hydroxycarotenoid 3,4-desaturase